MANALSVPILMMLTTHGNDDASQGHPGYLGGYQRVVRLADSAWLGFLTYDV